MQIGPYSVVRQIGRGGMGTVYEVRHPEIPRSLALKVVRQDMDDEVSQLRFTREGEALAAIDHPNVVSVHQLTSYGGHLILVTELVQGLSLEDRLKEAPLPPDEARVVMVCVADAIAQIHARGLVHRDLKPDNILLREDGSPVLIDFGLAREVTGSSLTQTGEILGTPSFMAPEQAKDASRADARSDVFALGALLFACLAGRPPFRGATTLQTLDRLLSHPPEWPPEAKRWPEDLRSLCDRALSKEPGERPQTALAFKEDLQSAPSTWSSRWGGIALMVVALLIVAVTVFFATRGAVEGPKAISLDEIRAGIAPLPSTSEGSPATLCWSGVRQVLAGLEPTDDQRALAKETTPAAHALGAAIAACDGDTVEARRRLGLHARPQRRELKLLPALASARAGRLNRRDARKALSALAEWGEQAPAELRALGTWSNLVAGRHSPFEAMEAASISPADSRPWLVEAISARLTPEVFDEPSLAWIADHPRGIGPSFRGLVTQRLKDSITRRIPKGGEKSFGVERYSLLSQAVRAFRAVQPHPVPLPGHKELVHFVIYSGVDVTQGKDKAPPTVEQTELKIVLAEALPDDRLAQGTAGHTLWQQPHASPERWQRLLVILRREIALSKRPRPAGEKPFSEEMELRLFSRLWHLLVGIQEALPASERDHEALAEALRATERMASLSEGYRRKDQFVERTYVLRLLGQLTREELDAIPPGAVKKPRYKVAQLYLAATLERDMTFDVLKDLQYVKREVTMGSLPHRIGQDLLWPKGGPKAPEAAQRELFIDRLVQTLEVRNHAYALHWRVQAARLALGQSPARCQEKLTKAADYARLLKWVEITRALETAAGSPDDATLEKLAGQALTLTAPAQSLANPRSE